MSCFCFSSFHWYSHMCRFSHAALVILVDAAENYCWTFLKFLLVVCISSQAGWQRYGQCDSHLRASDTTDDVLHAVLSPVSCLWVMIKEFTQLWNIKLGCSQNHCFKCISAVRWCISQASTCWVSVFSIMRFVGFTFKWLLLLLNLSTFCFSADMVGPFWEDGGSPVPSDNVLNWTPPPVRSLPNRLGLSVDEWRSSVYNHSGDLPNFILQYGGSVLWQYWCLMIERAQDFKKPGHWCDHVFLLSMMLQSSGLAAAHIDDKVEHKSL